MTWHDEKEPPVYAAGERQAELEALARRRRPFTRADLNKHVRVIESGAIGTVMNVDLDTGRVLVSGPDVRWWLKPEELERGRVVETWEPEQ